MSDCPYFLFSGYLAMGQVVTILSVAQIEDKPNLCHMSIININKTKPGVLMRLSDLLLEYKLTGRKIAMRMGCFCNKKI